MIEIKHRFTGAVLLRDETATSIREALVKAVANGAYLRGAYLDGAYLDGANLRGAYLGGANLRGAYLRGAYLDGAYLEGALWEGIQDDIYDILASAPAEVPGLLAALKAGQIDGSTYTGDCACLVGTIAKVRGCDYSALAGIRPDSSRPAERFFAAINPGDTPENHPLAKFAEQWIESWLLSNPHVTEASK